jgi:hypothetical protein
MEPGERVLATDSELGWPNNTTWAATTSAIYLIDAAPRLKPGPVTRIRYERIEHIKDHAHGKVHERGLHFNDEAPAGLIDIRARCDMPGSQHFAETIQHEWAKRQTSR